MNVELITFETKCVDFMRFSSILSIYWKFLESYHLSLILNISVKAQSILICWGCFEILRISSFQNCPWICIFCNIWGRYLGFYTAKGSVGHHCMSACHCWLQRGLVLSDQYLALNPSWGCYLLSVEFVYFRIDWAHQRQSVHLSVCQLRQPRLHAAGTAECCSLK